MGLWAGIFLFSMGLLVLIFGERLDEWHGGGDEMTVMICAIAAIIVTALVGLVRLIVFA